MLVSFGYSWSLHTLSVFSLQPGTSTRMSSTASLMSFRRDRSFSLCDARETSCRAFGLKSLQMEDTRVRWVHPLVL